MIVERQRKTNKTQKRDVKWFPAAIRGVFVFSLHSLLALRQTGFFYSIFPTATAPFFESPSTHTPAGRHPRLRLGIPGDGTEAPAGTGDQCLGQKRARWRAESLMGTMTTMAGWGRKTASSKWHSCFSREKNKKIYFTAQGLGKVFQQATDHAMQSNMNKKVKSTSLLAFSFF